jgi:hypothetical protein
MSLARFNLHFLSERDSEKKVFAERLQLFIHASFGAAAHAQLHPVERRVVF